MDLATDTELTEKLDTIIQKLEVFEELLGRFLPLLERYERASNANSFFRARKELKGER